MRYRLLTVGGYSYNPGGGLQISRRWRAWLSAYANGSLFSENGTVYIVYKNTKTGFASPLFFTALGFKFTNVLQTALLASTTAAT